MIMMAAVLGAAGMAQATWVTIGNAENAAQSPSNRDHRSTGGDGYGAVGYTYQISKYAVSIADWQTFHDSGTSGKVGTFNSTYNYWNDGTRNVGTTAPAIRISFHQAAQYCNWLTTGNASQGAYTINTSGAVTAIDRYFRNESGMLYVLPSENEWFKAAYYNGTTEKYTLYAHGADTAPPKSGDGSTGWNYDNALSPSEPWTVDKGTEEQNGTFNMMGNVWEWVEDTGGVLRGGRFSTDSSSLYASYRLIDFPATNATHDFGFRIVAISFK